MAKLIAFKISTKESHLKSPTWKSHFKFHPPELCTFSLLHLTLVIMTAECKRRTAYRMQYEVSLPAGAVSLSEVQCHLMDAVRAAEGYKAVVKCPAPAGKHGLLIKISSRHPHAHHKKVIAMAKARLPAGIVMGEHIRIADFAQEDALSAAQVKELLAAPSPPIQEPFDSLHWTEFDENLPGCPQWTGFIIYLSYRLYANVDRSLRPSLDPVPFGNAEEFSVRVQQEAQRIGATMKGVEKGMVVVPAHRHKLGDYKYIQDELTPTFRLIHDKPPPEKAPFGTNVNIGIPSYSVTTLSDVVDFEFDCELPPLKNDVFGRIEEYDFHVYVRTTRAAKMSVPEDFLAALREDVQKFVPAGYQRSNINGDVKKVTRDGIDLCSVPWPVMHNTLVSADTMPGSISRGDYTFRNKKMQERLLNERMAFIFNTLPAGYTLTAASLPVRADLVPLRDSFLQKMASATERDATLRAGVDLQLLDMRRQGREKTAERVAEAWAVKERALEKSIEEVTAGIAKAAFFLKADLDCLAAMPPTLAAIDSGDPAQYKAMEAAASSFNQVIKITPSPSAEPAGGLEDDPEFLAELEKQFGPDSLTREEREAALETLQALEEGVDLEYKEMKQYVGDVSKEELEAMKRTLQRLDHKRRVVD
ncbi:hypothetical protein JKP88DRAFT_313228 [Tribonema minus]|uniref:Uncharacterized protein n=1 Tax=Tribonema minus TaxID=303371 RepID=A0A836CH59_9STRA|nr:hypothetical protein JKP88DRAFT_313228 [Tribonema minus]